MCISYDDDHDSTITSNEDVVYTYSKVVSKIGDHSRGRPEGSLFDSYYIEV